MHRITVFSKGTPIWDSSDPKSPITEEDDKASTEFGNQGVVIIWPYFVDIYKRNQ